MYAWLEIETKIVRADGHDWNIVYVFSENLFQKQKAKNK